MKTSDPRLRLLLRQAKKVADSGKRSAAEQLYRQIIEETPDSSEAWLGLAAVSADRLESKQAYERVLDLSPGNEEALAGLALLEGKAPPETADSTEDGDLKDEPYNQSREWLETVTAPSRPPAVSDKETNDTGASNPAAIAPAAAHDPEPLDFDEDEGQETHALVCYRHPNRETSLRCYTCDRPICSDCAVKTPVGYRCPICIRESEDVFFNAKLTDYPLAVAVSFPLSLVAGYLVVNFGSGFRFFMIFIMIFIGGAVGGLIGRITKRVVSRRRGRYLPHVVAANVVLGVALPALIWLVFGFPLSAMITPGIYLFTAASAAFYQMK